jgi:hypothetical protein
LSRGHSGSENELFIEREILGFKDSMRGKVNRWPEKVMVNRKLEALALDQFNKTHNTLSYEDITGQGAAK